MKILRFVFFTEMVSQLKSCLSTSGRWTVASGSCYRSSSASSCRSNPSRENIQVCRALKSSRERDVAPWYGRSLMVRWVVRSILHVVNPMSYFSFQQVLHDWCNKGRGMCYPVCGLVHIKEPLLLIGKSSLWDGCGFPFSLSEWSLTICLTLYNRR